MSRSGIALVAATILLSACSASPAGKSSPREGMASTPVSGPAKIVMQIDLGTVTGRPDPGRQIVSGGWGSRSFEFGIDAESRVGPTSFDVAEDGRIVIADQENRRLVIASGLQRRILGVRLPDQFVDVAVSSSGPNVLVIKGGPGSRVQQYSWSGKLTATEVAGNRDNNLRYFNQYLYVSADSTDWQRLGATSLSGIPTPTGGELALGGGRGHQVSITRTESSRTQEWVLHSNANLGVAALAPRPHGACAVLVHWTNTTTTYQYVDLTSDGLALSRTLADQQFAEMTARSAYRFTDQALYRAASTPSGFAISRYSLN